MKNLTVTELRQNLPTWSAKGLRDSKWRWCEPELKWCDVHMIVSGNIRLRAGNVANFTSPWWTSYSGGQNSGVSINLKSPRSGPRCATIAVTRGPLGLVVQLAVLLTEHDNQGRKWWSLGHSVVDRLGWSKGDVKRMVHRTSWTQRVYSSDMKTGIMSPFQLLGSPKLYQWGCWVYPLNA